MRTLKFNIDGQTIERNPDCDFENLVPGSKGYLEVEFSFSSEWDNCVKVVEFIGANSKDVKSVVLINRKVYVPDVIAARRVFGLRVIGEKRNGYRITTDKIIVRQNGGV